MLRVTVLLGLLAALPGLPAGLNSATAPPPKQTSYGVDFWREAEGLAQSRIRAIAQTRDGYLWLGTDGGLIRYNGERFTPFSIETGDLHDNEVWALQEDDEGGLWIGTYGGGLTLLKDGHFKTFTTADGLPDDVVMSLGKDREGNIWMITPQGLGRYARGVITRITPASGLPDVHATAVCGNFDGGVIAATREGLYRFASGRFEPLPAAGGRLNGTPEHMFCGSAETVWFVFGNGVIEHRGKGTSTTYQYPRGAGRITRLYEDPRGGVWAVVGKRLARLQGGKFEPVPLDDGAADPGSIYSLCMDTEGNIWVGLQSNGLARLRVRQISTLSIEDGLPDERVRTVFEDSRGAVWIGTADGLARYSGGKVVSRWTEMAHARLGDVRSIAEDATGNIWISAGGNLLSMKNGRLSPVRGWDGRYEIEVLFKDPTGQMWVGTDGGGLFRLTDAGFRNYQTSSGLGSNHIRGILSDRAGDLWISTFGNGVSRYSKGRFTTFTTKDGLAGDRVLAMHEDEEGALWFATRRGLSRRKDGVFFTWTAASGMLNGFVYSIIDDAKGNFWFSSAQGIFRVSKRELREVAEGRRSQVVSVGYGEKDGMKTRAGNLGNQPAAWMTLEGHLLFSSMKGVVVVEPGRIAPNTFVPPVYIEKVLVNGREQPPRGNFQTRLGGGELEIHYTALSYSAPEKLRFKYMLDGFDAAWTDAGGRRFTYYANLPPGNYRFRVIAGNADGVWNEAGAGFVFYLKPPFYRTWLFPGLIFTGALLLIWMTYRLRMGSLKLRYMAVLAERNSISREIHDTLAQNLAGIALQLDAIHMQLPDVNNGLRQTLEEACNLTRYSLAEARKAIGDLRSNDLECRELSEALPEIARKIAASLQTRVAVFGLPRKLSPTTEKNLLRIFQEALANTVKHARARCVDVELTYAPDALTLRVRDDGQGFDTQGLAAEYALRVAHGHYGLIGMRERAERIGGRLTLNSSPGAGTVLCVELPLHAGNAQRGNG